MALRVLLADESTTIKKVMQLALQDFAVEVKSVQSGVDVVEVAKTYKPDIIFADILLQKRNGYEVSADVKRTPELKDIPVVLMWSSFMDLDEKQAQLSHCNQRLEKPFDVEALRQLILELVPKTRSQRLAHFLQFPESVTTPLANEVNTKATQIPPSSGPVRESIPPTEKIPVKRPEMPQKPPVPLAESQTITKTPPPPPLSVRTSITMPNIDVSAETSQEFGHGDQTPAHAIAQESSTPGWNMESFDEIESFELEGSSVGKPAEEDEGFKEIRIAPPPPKKSADLNFDDDKPMPLESLSIEDRDPWSHQDLARFKIELEPVEAENIEIHVDESHDSTLEKGEFLLNHNKPGAKSKVPNADDESSIKMPTLIELENYNEEQIEEALAPAKAGFSSVKKPTAKVSKEDAGPPSSKPQPSKTAKKTSPFDDLDLSGGEIPQLCPERLEQIIRSQSREIIEAVVRKVVPDLATDIIREELSRLLAEDRSR